MKEKREEAVVDGGECSKKADDGLNGAVSDPNGQLLRGPSGQRQENSMVNSATRAGFRGEPRPSLVANPLAAALRYRKIRGAEPASSCQEAIVMD